MDSLLRTFNGDSHTKEALLTYLTDYFEQKIIERAKAKKDVSSLADAIIELQAGFEQISIDYGIKQEPNQPINEAR